jgi:hypothetical protein
MAVCTGIGLFFLVPLLECDDPEPA